MENLFLFLFSYKHLQIILFVLLFVYKISSIQLNIIIVSNVILQALIINECFYFI